MPSQQKSCFFISPIKFLLVCLCLFPIPRILARSNDDSTNPSPSLLGRFWEIGCEFSGVVTRVRRSASPIPEEEEPNFEDPEELFKYLYPLADIKPGEDEGNVEGQRSHQDTHSLSSWLEDLMALWHSECHNHRRNKRSAKRMVPMGGPRDGVRRKPQAAKPRNRYNSMASSIGRNSSLKISSRQGTDDGVKYEEKDNQEEEVEEQEESTDEDDEEQETRYADEEDQEDDSVELKMKPAKPKPKPIDSAPAPIEVPEEKEDIFFTQYGGDIEYFFPLLSFGIPFDGEITLLGFHGFRGLFPY